MPQDRRDRCPGHLTAQQGPYPAFPGRGPTCGGPASALWRLNRFAAHARASYPAAAPRAIRGGSTSPPPLVRNPDHASEYVEHGDGPREPWGAGTPRAGVAHLLGLGPDLALIQGPWRRHGFVR